MSTLAPQITHEHFFAKIVPGAIFMAPFITGIEITQPESIHLLNINFILLFLLTSLVIGEIFDLASSAIPIKFRRCIYSELHEDDKSDIAHRYLSIQDRFRLKVHESSYTDNLIGSIPRFILINPKDMKYETIFTEKEGSFYRKFQNEFDVKVGNMTAKGVFELLLTELDRTGSNRLRTYETRFKMAKNIRNAVLFAVLLSLFAILQSTNQIASQILGFSLMGLITYGYVGVYVSQTASKEYLRKLFIEFYHVT